MMNVERSVGDGLGLESIPASSWQAVRWEETDILSFLLLPLNYDLNVMSRCLWRQSCPTIP